MDDFISREVAIRTVGEAERNNKSWNVALLNIPAADVRPVVKSRWIAAMETAKEPYMTEVYGQVYWCEKCGGDVIGTSNFCPHCGADMQEAKDD